MNRRLVISYQLSALSLRSVVALTGLIVSMSQSGFAQSTNAPTKLSYDSFRTVSDRNIFNPNRYARGSGRPTTRTSSTPAPRVESFSLVGILAYDMGVFAFFDGTKSDYKQALQANGQIGDYKVVSVSTEIVTLAAGTNTFDLKVGMQVRREDEGDWFLSVGGDAPRKRIVSTRTRSRGGSQSESPASGGSEEMTDGSEPEVIVIEGEPSANETSQENAEANTQPQPEADNGGVTDPVLLRLMQRRQQMNQ
jgi:hypothetical protein